VSFFKNWSDLLVYAGFIPFDNMNIGLEAGRKGPLKLTNNLFLFKRGKVKLYKTILFPDRTPHLN